MEEVKTEAKHAIAAYPLAAGFGVEILEAGRGYVIWKWSNAAQTWKSELKDIAGGMCFRAGNHWISLDECERTGIAR